MGIYHLTKNILLHKQSIKDYLPKEAHQIRKAYKNSGFVVTSKEIFKNHDYREGKKYIREPQKYYSFAWDFIQNAEVISLLLANKFTIEELENLYEADRAIFLHFMTIISDLLEEEIIVDKTDLLNFAKRLLENKEFTKAIINHLSKNRWTDSTAEELFDELEDKAGNSDLDSEEVDFAKILEEYDDAKRSEWAGECYFK